MLFRLGLELTSCFPIGCVVYFNQLLRGVDIRTPSLFRAKRYVRYVATYVLCYFNRHVLHVPQVLMSAPFYYVQKYDRKVQNK